MLPQPAWPYNKHSMCIAAPRQYAHKLCAKFTAAGARALWVPGVSITELTGAQGLFEVRCSIYMPPFYSLLINTLIYGCGPLRPVAYSQSVTLYIGAPHMCGTRCCLHTFYHSCACAALVAALRVGSWTGSTSSTHVPYYLYARRLV